MDVLSFSLLQWKYLILVLFRVAGIIGTTPFFGSPLFPTRAKIAFITVLALLLFPVLPKDYARLPQNTGQYVFVIFLEMSIGVIFGLAATLVFAGIQLGGQIMDHQIGFGLANVIDPVTQQQQSILSQFYFLFATLVFLASKGHHVLLTGMVDSFKLIPVGGLQLNEAWVTLVTIEKAGAMFGIAVRIAAPILVALLLASVAMGFMARTVPEMNIFIIGFALRIFMGMAIMIIVLPILATAMVGLFEELVVDLQDLLHMLGRSP